MSHQVTVNFEGLTIEVKQRCDQAIGSLCKIDKTIAKVQEVAKKVRTQKLQEYEKFLLESKEKIRNEIEKFQEIANSYRGQIMEQSRANNLRKQLRVQAQQLINTVSDLTGAKLAVIDELVNQGLIEKISEINQRMLYEASGAYSFDKSLLDKINSIEDVSLRELAHSEMVKGVTDYKVIIENAQKEYDKLLRESSFVEEMKDEMIKAGVSEEETKEILSKPITAETVTQIAQEANTAIADEKIRKETLKVIIKSIRDRGFIVDTKNNLKIDKQKNIVKLIAKKADGKTAEFEISLNGKFMYHFDGYEGQACNKDITPFIEDLKNIYDINILHEEVQWSNPDKISTQKYQYIDRNKGKK